MEKITYTQEEQDRMLILKMLSGILGNEPVTAKDFIYRIVNRHKFFKRRTAAGSRYFGLSPFLEDRWTEECIYRQLLILHLTNEDVNIGQYIYLNESNSGLAHNSVTSYAVDFDIDGNINYFNNKGDKNQRLAYASFLNLFDKEKKDTPILQEKVEIIRKYGVKNIYSEDALKNIYFTVYAQKSLVSKLPQAKLSGRILSIDIENTTDELKEVILFGNNGIKDGIKVSPSYSGITWNDVIAHIKAADIHVGKIRVELIGDRQFEEGETFFFSYHTKDIIGSLTTIPIELIENRKQFIKSAIETDVELEFNYRTELSFDLTPKQKIRLYFYLSDSTDTRFLNKYS